LLLLTQTHEHCVTPLLLLLLLLPLAAGMPSSDARFSERDNDSIRFDTLIEQ